MTELRQTLSSELLRTDETRQAFLEQLAHLGDEVNALKRHVQLIPSGVLEGRPLEGDPSFKEIYGLLVAYDRSVYGPAVLQLSASGSVRVDTPDEKALLEETAWNDVDLPAIIDRAATGRSKLVERLARLDLETWRRRMTIDGEMTDVFGLAHHIVQHDATLLRRAAYRLHESRLSSRDEDLPK